MEQKLCDPFTLLVHSYVLKIGFQFLKFGVSTEALQSYVPLNLLSTLKTRLIGIRIDGSEQLLKKVTKRSIMVMAWLQKEQARHIFHSGLGDTAVLESNSHTCSLERSRH